MELCLSVEEYVFVDFIFACKKFKVITYADFKESIGFGEMQIKQLFLSLREKGFLETKKSAIRTTQKWNQFFDDENAIPEIVEYLNRALGSSFKHESNDTKKHVKARLKEGYTFDNFKMVIDSRNNEWGEDAQMRQYLRPATLFGTKFESYLQYAIANTTKPIINGREQQGKPTNFDHLKGAYSDIPD
jgi:uncharacterized phage protein (TIGR02220 family)